MAGLPSSNEGPRGRTHALWCSPHAEVMSRMLPEHLLTTRPSAGPTSGWPTAQPPTYPCPLLEFRVALALVEEGERAGARGQSWGGSSAGISQAPRMFAHRRMDLKYITESFTCSFSFYKVSRSTWAVFSIGKVA